MNIAEDLSQFFSWELLKPFGLLIRPKINKKLMLLDGERLIQLARQHQLVLLRGFEAIIKDDMVSYAQSMGALLEWDFGRVMEMQVHREPRNYLFTHGPVPFHWDGAFLKAPSFLLFNCVEAPLKDSGGETIFSNTELVWHDATSQEKDLWRQYMLTFKTEKKAHYGGEITVPMVQQHPHTQETILRFAEPVPNTMLNPVEAMVEGLQSDASQAFFQTLAARFYQASYCYEHVWKANDFIIADNHALIHGRREFKEFSPRHLRRIQVM